MIVYVNVIDLILNVIDLTKDNIIKPLSIKEILNELENWIDDWYRTLSISQDEDLEPHLEIQSNTRFNTNYFNVGLKAWQVNMDVPIRHLYI